MNRETNPPAPHVEEFRIYPEDTPAVNPGGWVGCWRLLCPKYTKVTQRVKGCAGVVIPDALTIRYTDWIKPLKTAKVLLRVKWRDYGVVTGRVKQKQRQGYVKGKTETTVRLR